MSDRKTTGAPDCQARIASLTQILRETAQQLSALNAGEAGRAADHIGHLAQMPGAQAHLAKWGPSQKMALLNADGVIVAVNEHWRSFDNAKGEGAAHFGVGCNYLDTCDRILSTGEAQRGVVAAGLRAVLAGDRMHFSIECDVATAIEMPGFLFTATRLETGEQGEAAMVHVNISDQVQHKQVALPSVHLLHAFAEGTSTHVYVKDLNGRYLLCNEALADFTGQAIEQIVGCDDRALYGDDEAAMLMENDRALFAAGAVQVSDICLTGLRGRHHFRSTRVPYRSLQGELMGVIGTARDITDEISAQQALRDSEAMLDMAGRTAKVGGWRMEVSSGRLYWSDIVAHLHDEPAGYSPSMDEGIASFVAEHRATVREAVERCIKLGVPYDLEVQKISATGRRFWVRTMGEAVRDAAGDIVYIQGALQDITERKLAALDAHKFATRLTNTLESITDGLFILDRDWRLTYINREGELLLGSTRAELLGRVLWEAYPEALGTDFEYNYLRAMGGETGVSFETNYLPLGMWFGVDCHPSEDGLSVYFRDVTARRAAHQQLKLLEASVAQLNDMVVITEVVPDSPQGLRIVFVNDAFVRMTGFSREEVMGRSPAVRNGPLTDRTELGRILEAIGRFEPVHAELLEYTKSGSAHWIELDVTPVAVSGEQFTHFVSVERDISERRRNVENLRTLNAGLEDRVRLRTLDLERARELAEQATRAKSSFLAMMSHEIRTPMNGVVGMIDVLERSELQPEQLDLVKTARDSAYALMAIVDDVLDFSKIEAGQFDIASDSIDVEKVIEGAYDALHPMAESQGVNLRLYTDPRLPNAMLGDAARLRQVLINLLSNAIKFSHGLGRRGAVSLRALCDADTLVVDVTDNGIGMAPDTVRRLFSPFTQADASTTRRFGGTGLGLSISHRLVSLMGGEVLVRSVPDEGTTFSVRLPFVLSPETVARPTPEPQLLANLPCLVLGASAGMAGDLADYLSHAGAYVRCRQTSMQAQAWLLHCEPGLCVVIVADTVENNASIVAACHSVVQECPELRPAFMVIESLERPRHQEAGQHWLSGERLHRAKFVRCVELAAQLQAPDVAARVTVHSAPLRAERIQSSSPLILVAEDNEINQKVLNHQLGLLGYRAKMVANGVEALACWRQGGYVMLLTDLHMPLMDGYSLVAALRAEERDDERLPIIALTANALREEEVRCLQAGMDVYLSKPVRLDQLQAVFEAWLGSASAPSVEGAIGEVVPTRSAPVDFRVLTDLLGDDGPMVEEVLANFRSSTTGTAMAMKTAHEESSVRAIFEVAHKLKSTALAIGAARLGEICAEIELVASKTQHAAELDALVREFEDELFAVFDFLEKR